MQDNVLDHRPRLIGLAYRLLGEMDEAEDVVAGSLPAVVQRGRAGQSDGDRIGPFDGTSPCT
jgi:DNA-directed RNA polymerase specialized sigma24 family protein